MCVLGWQGVALTSIPLQECNLSRFRNAIEGAAFAETSVPLRNIVLSAVAVLVVSLSRCQNGKNCDGSEGKLGAWRENGREDRA